MQIEMKIGSTGNRGRWEPIPVEGFTYEAGTGWSYKGEALPLLVQEGLARHALVAKLGDATAGDKGATRQDAVANINRVIENMVAGTWSQRGGAEKVETVESIVRDQLADLLTAAIKAKGGKPDAKKVKTRAAELFAAGGPKVDKMAKEAQKHLDAKKALAAEMAEEGFDMMLDDLGLEPKETDSE